MEPVVFRRWSNKGHAVLSTFHKVIRIATLSLTYTLVQGQTLSAQTDTTTPQIFYDLEEVEAIGEKAAELYAPALRQLLIISQENIAPAPSRSLGELLDHHPGIDIRTRGPHGIQADLNIQGGSFDQSQVLFNGLEITDPQTGHFSLDLPVNLSATKRIEVLKGPSAKRYGPGAYTGAVNIITRPDDSLHFTANASYGSFQTWDAGATLHLPVGETKNLLSLSSASTDGYTQNTDATKHDIFFHNQAVTGKVKSDILLGWNSKQFGALAFYTPRYPDQYEETQTVFAALKLGAAKDEKGFSGSIHWRRHYDHFTLFRENPSAYENFHRSDLLGVNLGRKFYSSLGVTNIHTRWIHDRMLSTTLGEPIARPVPAGNNGVYNHFAYRNRWSLMADHQLQVGKLYISAGLLLQAGIRDLLSPGIYPGLDVSYLLSPRLQVFASANRSMRLPTYTDLYYEGPRNRGNPDLRPEKAVTIESGINFKTETIRTDIALFYRNGTETIDWIWRDSVWVTSNLTKLDTYGGETTLEYIPGNPGPISSLLHSIRISYAYTGINKSSDAFVSNYALDNLRHKAIFNLRLSLPWNIYVDLMVRWQDRNGSFLYYESPDAMPYERDYEPFWLADLHTGIRLNRFTLFVNVTNIWNTPYRDIGSVVMPGRWIMTGIEFR